MAVDDEDPWPDSLYRIARAPDPLAWPDRERYGANRFDLPGHDTRVLYAAFLRHAAFVETLARLRSPLTDLLAEARLPPAWFAPRRIARFRMEAPLAPFLDLNSSATVQSVRRRFASTLRVIGLVDVDLGDVLSRDRRVTQAIARWAFDQGYGGIRYPSRFHPALDLWAIFEGAPFTEVAVAAIEPDDPDLIAVAALFRLTIARV